MPVVTVVCAVSLSNECHRLDLPLDYIDTTHAGFDVALDLDEDDDPAADTTYDYLLRAHDVAPM